MDFSHVDLDSDIVLVLVIVGFKENYMLLNFLT